MNRIIESFDEYFTFNVRQQLQATVACNVPIDLDQWLHRLSQADHGALQNESHVVEFFTIMATTFARSGDVPKVERIIGILRDEGYEVNSLACSVRFDSFLVKQKYTWTIRLQNFIKF